MISVVLPVYNHLEDATKPCIESLLKYTSWDDKEALVVANGCKDGTKEYVESLGDPFKLIWFDEPMGFVKAVNTGIRESKGDFVVLLNNDIILLEQEKDDWIRMLLAPFLEDGYVGMTGPALEYCHQLDRHFLISFCVMVSREVFRYVGLLDENFTPPGGGDDIDFSVRVVNAGYRLVQVPPGPAHREEGRWVGPFPIYHAAEVTFKETPGWKDIMEKNLEALAKKHRREEKA